MSNKREMPWPEGARSQSAILSAEGGDVLDNRVNYVQRIAQWVVL